MNLPNKLTVLRVCLIPVFLFFFFCTWVPSNYVWALVVFVAASLTDMLDGQIARRNNLITDFGKLMDPLADKLLVMSALACLLCSPTGVVMFWGPVGNVLSLIIIMAREFIVTAIRQLAMGKGVVIAADKWGKIKTITQMIWISLVLLGLSLLWTNTAPWAYSAWEMLHTVLFWCVLFFTIFSGANYVWKNRELFADA
jgi:CDP-diacylglycerol--glycerol-3-phosphate 3-phosphatidyltransferase